ncbi:MAG: ABC transporter substrate-binding protein [Clostridiales Family XIII bacterium]|jgi:NitT/TauT family transport system substrate-binding protein|nr:ABC transporter substrate-binding protein [Clostridiales Family XIII bacterium]
MKNIGETKILKTILVVALACVLAFAFAACSGSGSKAADEAPAADAGSSAAEEPAAEEPVVEEEEPAAVESVKPDITPEKTDIQIGTLNSTAHLLAFVAAEEGFFAEEGLTATVTPFASSGELVTGLEEDKLDVALIGSVPTITNQSNGHDITIFGGAMTNGHGYVIKKEYTEGLTDWDITLLKGRNIASVRNSIQDLELLILLDAAGIEVGEGEDQANIVYFESQKEAFAALAGAEIDAASVYSPYASVAKNQGYEVVYYCNEEEAFENQPCCRQVAATSQIAERPQTYLAIERAFIKAYKFSQENKDKTIEDVKVYIDLEPEDLEYEIYGGHSVSHPDPDKVATTAVKEKVVSFGYAENDYDLDQYYNTAIYKQAVESLIAEYPEDDLYKELLADFEKRDA